MSKWNELSMSEKAEMIGVAVKNGLTNLPDIRQKYNEFAEGGSKEGEEGVNTIVPFTQRREVIITPDFEYNQYLNTLPDNQRFTPNDKYDSYFYWKLNGRPRNFEEAYNKGMFHYDHSDNGYHANSIAFDDNTGVGYFMKPKTHDTVGYELDWFNKGLVTEEGGKQRPVTPEEAVELEEFRKNYFLTNDPDRPNYYRYQPIEKAEGGKIHIKPENRGKFTALKERTGHSASWFKEHGTPAQRKMAIFELNSRKWKHGEGGDLENNDTSEDAWDYLKAGIKKARQKVKDWGLDRSPGHHIAEILTPIQGSSLGLLPTAILNTGRKLGIDKFTKGDNNDTQYRQNIYNVVDPTTEIPNDTKSAVGYGLTAIASRFSDNIPYYRTKTDSVADAAWAKRLGLDYNQEALIDNGDGTVRLPKALEDEIPTDTLFLKKRIEENEKRLKRVRGDEHRLTRKAVELDKKALEALRKTYSTGEPVMMDEHSHVNRDWRGLTEETVGITPLNTLHRYTVQYDKDNNRMKYWDWYDFNEFESFVPGKPFKIQGSIDLNKKK